jgi:predicted naringenin-chalcone synthase
MSLTFHGLGTALPVHRMSQVDALDVTHNICCTDERQKRLASMLFRRSGVEGRNTAVPHPLAYEYVSQSPSDAPSLGPTTGERMQMYAANSPGLAAAACERALASANATPKDVTHLVTVSCTGFDAPGVDVSLFDKLGLRQTVQRVHVGYMGCHGAINGLRAARGLAAAERNAVVLLCACELCSLHFRFTWDDEGIIGNALFADGAAALVTSWSDELPADRWSLVASGSCLIPDSRNAMSWRVGDHGFDMRLTADVPRHIEESLRPWLSEWLARHDVALDAVDHWVIHPGGPRILDACQTALQLQPQQTALSRAVLNDHGNMSSPTVLFILERLEATAPRGTCVLLGFGPGLMAEACLLKRG